MNAIARFVLIWIISAYLAPRLSRFLEGLAARVPRGSLRQEVLEVFSSRYAHEVIRSFGETMGDLVLGPKAKGRRR